MIRGCPGCGPESVLGSPLRVSRTLYGAARLPRSAGLRVGENHWSLFQCTGKGFLAFGAKTSGT